MIANGVMIATFTFSAVSYSRICRGAEGFVRWQDFVIGVFATITLFALVRIFDEFKDKEDDAKYRRYLPVPRGLVTLSELKKVGIVIGVIQIAAISIFQFEMLLLYTIVLVYLSLMGVEFFVPFGDSIDVEAERQKIEQELDYSRGFLTSVQKKLSNERFVNSAPKNIVDMERKKESDALTKIALLEEKLNTLV